MTNEINEIRNSVASQLVNSFTSEQLQEIDFAMAKALRSYNVTQKQSLPVPADKYRPLVIQEFIARKKIKGLSDASIERYEYILYDFAAWATKDLTEMTDLDLIIYLDYTNTTHNMNKCSLEGYRLVLSSFYTYLHDTGKMAYNPMKSVDPIKYKSKVRQPLSDMEMEKVRDACTTYKEKAYIEVMYSTGGRVSEIVSMNWTDIDFDNRRIVITGKGDKERYVFFTAKAIFAIQKYLESRDDDNPALFVSNHKPHDRMTIAGIQWAIRKIGERAELGRSLYPHLFRHTFATDMLSHGTPIDEVQRMLGHEKIETTQIYAKTTVDMLQYSHKLHIA